MDPTPTGAEPIRFVVDASSSSGPALVKDKFGVYQTPFLGTAGLPDLTRMESLLEEAGVRDLRYEMGWGKPDAFAFDQISGSPTAPTIDFGRLDPFLLMLKRSDVRPLLAMTYDPLPLKTGSDWQRWKDVPSNLPVWQDINRRYAEHYRDALGIEDIAYEIWNEPDLPGDGGKVFFNGDAAAYGQVYAHAAAGIRAGDPDAWVGGPGIAYDTRYVTESGLLTHPVDFVSIHAYANAVPQLAAIGAAMGNRDLPVYLTEYASYTTFSATGLNSRSEGAVQFFRDVKALLQYPRLRKVYWAQWIDDSLGMITYDLRRKAIFNAYRIYQTLLPVRRAAVAPDEAESIGTLAAADSTAAGVVLWNRGSAGDTVEVTLDNLSFESGTLRLYRIDTRHASYVDDPSTERLTVDGEWSFSGRSATWRGRIPGQGVVFLRAVRKGVDP